MGQQESKQPLEGAGVMTTSEQALRDELLNIADPKRFNREMFSNDSEWADWAQSRARYAAEKVAALSIAPAGEQTGELLPCPFCGGPADCSPDEIGSGGQHVPPYFAGCRSCYLGFSDDENTTAIAAWNRRAALTTHNEHILEMVAPAPERQVGEALRLSLKSAGFAGLKSAEVIRLHKALSDLIALKDYKDAHGKDDYYQTAQPIAWINARNELGEPAAAPERQSD